jgi:hypothetical protein
VGVAAGQWSCHTDCHTRRATLADIPLISHGVFLELI